VWQPERIKGTDFDVRLKALKPDVAVVTAYGRILPKAVLEAPVHGCVNVHASLLPRFRGAAPIQWAIASGDEKTGVCLMKMDEGMDTGAVIARAELVIGADDTSATMHDKLSVLGAKVLEENLPAFLAGTLAAVAQPAQGVVMAPMVKKEDGKLDFARPAAELERRSRAFDPWPGAWTMFGGQVLKVKKVRVAAGQGAPGMVLSVGAAGIEVACGVGSLVLLELQPEGKKPMTAQQFLAGRPIAAGQQPFMS
jgi:methionyl-tRNA formyltransferase